MNPFSGAVIGMKQLRWMPISFLAIGLFLFGVSCKGKNNPASLPIDTTPVSTGPIIVGNFGFNEESSFSQVTVYVSDSTGNTGTVNTGAMVISNGVTTSLTKHPLLTNTRALTMMGVPYITGHSYSASVDYVVGQVYTFDVNVDGAMYSASVTAFTGNPKVESSDGSAGVTCSWTNNAGNYNCIHLISNDIYSATAIDKVVGPPIPSNPFVVQNADFETETPGAGNVAVALHIVQRLVSAFPNSSASSCLIINLVAQDQY